MKKFLRIISMVIVSFFSNNSLAEVTYYHFSYQFEHGEKVQGSMYGIVDGDTIKDIRLSSIYFTFSNPNTPWGTFYPEREHNVYLTLGNREWDFSERGITSLNGLKNTFTYSLKNTQISLFYLYSLDGSDTSSAMLHQADYGLTINETYDPNRWSLVAAPIPEPATYTMLLAGVGLLGLVIYRRKSNYNFN